MNTLNQLCPGESAHVTKILLSGSMRRRLLDLGLCTGTNVECVSESPSGNPKAYNIRGAVIAIRLEDSKKILIS